MRKLFNRTPFVVLVAVFLMTGIAATPATLVKPDQPTAAATANAGELLVTWNASAGAQFYTIGWAEEEGIRQMLAAGREWRDAFHFATIPADYTGYTINGLKTETEYYAIVGAQSSRFGATDFVWSEWSELVSTAGLHGEGFCPITGLEIPAGGYLGIGDTQTWSDATFKLDNATLPSALTFSGSTFVPNERDQFLRLCSTWNNRTGTDMYFLPGFNNNLSTDAGIGFAGILEHDWLDTSPVADGETGSACDLWVIPDSATTAVYAIYDASSDNNAVLFRIDLSTLSEVASSASSSTSP